MNKAIAIKGIYIKFLVLIFCFSSSPLLAQGGRSAVIKGSVKDTKGNPIEFARVYIKNTQAVAEADHKGHFFLKVRPGQSMLCADFMGYRTYENTLRIRHHDKMELHIVLEEKNQNLQEVVVEAKSAVQRVKESAFNVVAIDTKALYNTTMGISSALDRVSGVKIRESGGLGSNTQISMNGFSDKYVKIFIDGVPMEGAGSSFQINNIPVNLAERIEVYKGVVPVEFGTEAMGGAINIVTKQTKNTRIDASYSFGSFNTHKSNVSLAYTTKNGFTVSLDAYQNYSDNNYKVKTQTEIFSSGGSTIPPDKFWFKRFHDSYHNEAIILKAGFVNKPWATRFMLGVNLNQEKADVQHANLTKIVFGGRERENKGVSPSLAYLKKDLFAKKLTLSLNADYNQIKSNNIDTMARNYNWHQEWIPKPTKGEGEYTIAEFKSKNGSLRTNLSYNFLEKHFFSINNLYNQFVRQTTDAVANEENSTAATFMKRKNSKNVTGLSYKYTPSEKWHLLGFVKHYRTETNGPIAIIVAGRTDYIEETKSANTTGYGFAGTYHLTHNIQLKGSFEQAYRLPNQRELFGDELLETGNVNLKPENSKNVNVNVVYDNTFNDHHTLMLDAGFAYRDIRDYIRRTVSSNNGLAASSNHGKVRNLGVDFEARYFYKKALSLGGNLTFQNIRNLEKLNSNGVESGLYKDRMPNVPHLFGNFDVSYNFRNVFFSNTLLSAGYNLRYVHEFYKAWKNEGGDKMIPSQLSHDVNATYALKDGRYNISFEANNITDKMLFDNYDLPKPGRNFSIKFRYFFFQN